MKIQAVLAIVLIACTNCASNFTMGTASSSEVNYFQKSTFKKYLKSTFNARAGSTVIELQLVEVAGSKKKRVEFISLLFRGPLDKPLKQHLYDLSHEKLEMFSVLLVPVGKDEKGFLYEAILSRLLQ